MNLKNRSEYKYFLSDTASFLFCILAVCLIIVSVALICMLNNNYPEHSLKQQKRFVYWMISVFTFTYTFRSAYTFKMGDYTNGNIVASFFWRQLLQQAFLVVFDCPAILCILFLHMRKKPQKIATNSDGLKQFSYVDTKSYSRSSIYGQSRPLTVDNNFLFEEFQENYGEFENSSNSSALSEFSDSENQVNQSLDIY
jgi:hypothetical protein